MDRKKTPSEINSFEEIHGDSKVTEQDPAEKYSPQDVVQQIKETADKLLRDDISFGDIKLVNTALKELRYAFKVFAEYRDRRKVTVFGSARIPLDHPACLQAIEFSRRIAEEGYMVITGAAKGIMEAGHVGAGREQSIGVNILLPFEQEANPIIADDRKLMHLKYFFTRKLLFIKEADAVALFPGGFGTLDECFEALTLIQTGKSHLFPVVMVDEPGGDFWQACLQWVKDVLIKRGLISNFDLSLFKVTDSVEEAVQEVVGFYRIYHSMRYVGKDLVLRLKSPPSEKQMNKINRDFKDILQSGRFELTEAHPHEANEEDIATLPRMRFHFDRRRLGRLRQLIDLINQVD